MEVFRSFLLEQRITWCSFSLIRGLRAETVCGGTSYVDISTTTFSITQFYTSAYSVSSTDALVFI